MICPNCGIEGKGPRFGKRHPVLCKARAAEAKSRRDFIHTKTTRSVTDIEDTLEEHGKDRLAHFAALSTVMPYIWISGTLDTVDLRTVNLEYGKNLRDWMLSHSYSDTPYDDTPQFKAVTNRIGKLEEYLALARKILTKKE